MEYAIGLGANLGDRLGAFRTARLAIAALPGTRLVAGSRIYETAPEGLRDQPPFLNAVLLVWSTLPPLELLQALHAIERSAGRDRRAERVRWGPRALDLDVLLGGEGGSLVLAAPELSIPHPHAFTRRFVVEPLADVVPAWRHPVSGVTVASALQQLIAAAPDDASASVPFPEAFEPA